MLHQYLVNVIAKKEKKFGKSWARPGFEPGTTDPKSAMLTPRPRFEEKCLKIPKFTDQVFLNVDFSHFLIIRYQSNPYQKLKKCPNNIVINFSVK